MGLIALSLHASLSDDDGGIERPRGAKEGRAGAVGRDADGGAVQIGMTLTLAAISVSNAEERTYGEVTEREREGGR